MYITSEKIINIFIVIANKNQLIIVSILDYNLVLMGICSSRSARSKYAQRWFWKLIYLKLEV